ncbi:hypothetical protein Sm713_76980 [Streptomyces sp. TS71-3]|nr:hypothetical protein Sm713_76980 [Streptomyces sp. TS71-3]
MPAARLVRSSRTEHEGKGPNRSRFGWNVQRQSRGGYLVTVHVDVADLDGSLTEVAVRVT